MRTLDWVARHESLSSLLAHKPKLGEAVINRLGPNECLVGKDCPTVICGGVIPLQDAPRLRPHKRQLTLECFGIIKRKR